MVTDKRKVIVVSAINFFEGGPLSILEDLLLFASEKLVDRYNVIALVHDKTLLKIHSEIRYIEFPRSRSSWLFRLYYEYCHFKKISSNFSPYLWFSLHDITPNVVSEKQVVYCHNPSPFYSSSLRDLFISPKLFLFSVFYKYLYRINIKKNDWIIVQQNWMRKEFIRMFNIDNIIVSPPKVDLTTFLLGQADSLSVIKDNNKFCFFYPAFPRMFKNIEILCEAVVGILEEGINNVSLVLTIDGTENSYAQRIVKKYERIPNIEFKGLLKRAEVFALYKSVDCLVFPSKLETWGLPITEYKLTNNPMIVADLPYAKETVGDYDKVVFFDPIDVSDLKKCMSDMIEGTSVFNNHVKEPIMKPLAENWDDLFSIILDKKEL